MTTEEDEPHPEVTHLLELEILVIGVIQGESHDHVLGKVVVNLG